MNKVLIIGAGSIGTLIGASLLKAGFDVTFAGRSGSVYTAQIKRHGLSIVYPSGEQFWIAPSRARIRFVDTEEELKEKFKLIIVTVKSYHLASVTSYIRSHSTQDTILFHAQNGIPYWWFDDNAYFSSLNPTVLNKINTRRYLNSVDRDGMIFESLGDRTLVGCVIKAPCGKTAPNQIEVKKAPKMIVGLTKSEDNYEQKQVIWQLGNLFSNYGLETSYTCQIRVEVCHKLAINIATNVLSALTGCIIAELTANFYINKLIENILLEINKIFQAYGIEKASLPTQEKIYSYIKQPGSQRHLPSLAQDFSHHKKGEISLISAPVEMAQIAEIKVPILFSLSELLKLGQTYALKNSNEKFNLLSFDKSLGHFWLSDDAWKSNILNEIEISNVFTCLDQINLFALGRNAA